MLLMVVVAAVMAFRIAIVAERRDREAARYKKCLSNIAQLEAELFPPAPTPSNYHQIIGPSIDIYTPEQRDQLAMQHKLEQQGILQSGIANMMYGPGEVWPVDEADSVRRLDG